MQSTIRSKQSLDQRLLIDKSALENARSLPKVAELLSVVGYTENRIAEGLEFYSRAMNLIKKQKAEYGEQYAATEELHTKRELANSIYSRAYKIARILFNDDVHAMESLMLKGARKKDLTGWLRQALTFYGNLLATPQFLEVMMTSGYSDTQLQEDKNSIEMVALALQKQLEETGEAQASTKARDNAVDNFMGWMNTFYKMADIALEEQPQMKEQLGMLDRS